MPPFLGGSSATNPLKILDLMPPYLKTLFEQKKQQKFDHFDHFCLDDPFKLPLHVQAICANKLLDDCCRRYKHVA